MSQQTTINIKTDSKIKKAAQELAVELGISLSDVLNISLRQFVRDQGITVSKYAEESLDEYKNKSEIIKGYKEALKLLD